MNFPPLDELECRFPQGGQSSIHIIRYCSTSLERRAVSLGEESLLFESFIAVNVDNIDIVSMELESSVTQGTELHYLYEEPYWSDERVNVVVQPIPFECTPVQVHVPLEQSPTSGNVIQG